MIRSLILITTLSLSGTATAARWGVGAVASSEPGLTLQYSKSMHEAYHVTSQVHESQVVRISGDYQRFFFPETFRIWSKSRYDWGFYSGIGLQGETSQEHQRNEIYHLRLPIGTQLDLSTLPMQIFVEATGLIGPLFNTGFLGSGSMGVRAYF